MTPAEHLPQLHQLALELAQVPVPSVFDLRDGPPSVAAQREALRIAGSARAIASSYITTAPIRYGGEPRKLPLGYADVGELVEALAARADWLNHAWLCNQYGLANDRREPQAVTR